MLKNTPATPSLAVQAMSTDWHMIESLMGGTGAMRKAGERLLPKNPAEDKKLYEYRLKLSTLYNAFKRTVETMSSKPFSEPVRLGDDVPTFIKNICGDVDLQGSDLQAFFTDVFNFAMQFGLSHVLVDYPRTEPGQTLADQRKSGVRPYFIHIKPQSVLGFKSERINGVETLTQLRYSETVIEPTDEWGEAEIKQIRVLERGYCRIYRLNEKQEWFLYDEYDGSTAVA
jgi:hypothetical protein